MSKTTHGIQVGKVKIKLTGTGAGLEVYVKPLTLALVRALSEQAAKRYPYPDEKSYQRTRSALPDAMPSLDEKDDTLSAVENPAYRQACAEIDITRALWLTDAAIDVCVTCDAKDVLIAAYRAELTTLHELGASARVLPWADTLYHFLCGASAGGITEWSVLIDTLNGQMPLTEGETRDGMTFFRLDIQRYIRKRFAGIAGASSAKKAIQDSIFDADGRDERLSELGENLRPDHDDAQQLARTSAPNADYDGLSLSA